MPGSATSRRRSSPRRDRDRKDRPRDKDGGQGKDREHSRDVSDRRESSSFAELMHYEPRGRDERPAAPQRHSTHGGGGGGGSGGDVDETYHDCRSRGDKYYPPRASDARRRGGGPPPTQRGRPRSESRSKNHDHRNSSKTRARSSSRAAHGGHGSGDTARRNPKEEKGEGEEEEAARKKRNQAIQAALMAGALEAMRQRSQPGDWIGEKGFRVATAAISAGLVDVGRDKNPNHAGVGNLIKSTVGGLLVDKVANSARK